DRPDRPGNHTRRKLRRSSSVSVPAAGGVPGLGLRLTAGASTMTQSPSKWLSSPILPVVVVDDTESALFVAGAFMEAGLQQIEITLRTPQSLAAITAVARRFPGMRVAAGTVLAARQVAQARDAGATLCVSPGFTPALSEAMRAAAMPWIPGVT